MANSKPVWYKLLTRGKIYSNCFISWFLNNMYIFYFLLYDLWFILSDVTNIKS